MKRESDNLRRIIKFEKGCGRKAKDVSRDYLGYDIESTDERTGEKRYIEVKSCSHVALTPNERDSADRMGAAYFLYVVEDDTLFIVRDPTRTCEVKAVEVIETQWRVSAWREGAESFSMPERSL